MKGMWKTYRLGDICKKIGSGATPRGGNVNYLDSGISFIRSQNVYNLRFQMEGLVFIGEEAAQKLQSVTVEPGDILLNITGDSVARTCQVPQEILPARVNQHVLIVRPNHDLVSSFFLSYVLASPQMQAEMLNLAVGKGASRNALTKEMVEALCISLPPLEEQERIAGILGAYDDLIAVNERRMALLEEAAHRLYRDRFVAHVDPTWDRKPLGEMAEFIHNTYRPSENWPSITYLDTGNITRNRIDTLVTAPFRDLPTSAKRKVSPGDFIYSTVRPNKLHYGLFLQVPEHFLVSTAFAVIRGKITISSSIYLYHLLIDEQMTDYLHAIGEQTSATYPTINEDDMAPITVLCPPLEIQEEFTRYVLPYHEAFDTLARENALLREGRDKLLPRLLREEA